MKIAIFDADKQAMETCTAHVKQLAKQHGVDIQLKYYESADNLIFQMDDTRKWPDLLYLNLSSQEAEGVRVARWLREQGCTCEMILLAVSFKYVLFGYDMDALYYFIRGKVEQEKFESVFLKAVRKIEVQSPQMVTFAHNGESRIMHINDILYFEVENRMVILYSGDGKNPFRFYSTLERVKNILPKEAFIRIHRSYLVSVSKIKQLYDRKIILRNGVVLPVGRTYYSALINFLNNR
ncbi:MAG: LytTR family transcriptional regulator DNA-binding domain-containing protein [Christensenellaceae bacterium]|jgi:DNA-binding LytR/AlgR family response regulator|nr:LytTR family transcriptional regulator DNA-binding domain-containing protein [Christensenellaceae bacterium]